MKLTFYGHASFGAEVNGKNLLFDPFISQNPLASKIDIKKIPADYILVSHAHMDHTADVVEIAQNTDATVVTVVEVGMGLEKQGLKKMHQLNIGGRWNFDFGQVRMVNATHTSSFMDGSYGGNPAGFIITAPDVCFYFSGDTDVMMDMQLFGQMHKLDFAILCIGGNYTMDVEAAVIAAGLLGVKRVVGMHYDTFGYIKIDHLEAKANFAAAGVELILLDIGVPVEI